MLNRNDRGFTLLELLFAIVILTITIVPLMLLLPQIMATNMNIEQTNRAGFLAQKKMEEMKTKSLTYFNWDYSESTATSFSSPDAEYMYTVADDYGLYVKQITVNVWHDEDNDGTADADEEQIELRTIVTNRGRKRAA